MPSLLLPCARIACLLSPLALTGCGGSDSSAAAPLSLLEFVQPAQSVVYEAGPIPFQVLYAPLEVLAPTLTVVLDGEPQPGPFVVSNDAILVTVAVEEPGPHTIAVSVLGREDPSDEFQEEQIQLNFTVVPAEPAPTLPLVYAQFGEASIAQFGITLESIDDVDGDGTSDYLAGSPRSSSGGLLSGLVELRSGSTGELLQEWTGPEVSEFGAALASLGDLDGDGLGDFAVGAPNDSTGFLEGGAVFAYSSATGQELWRYEGGSDLERAGFDLAETSDYDGDGIGELLVGSAFSHTEVCLLYTSPSPRDS